MKSEPQRPLILIYGNSPRLQRMERTLRAAPDLRVIQIDPPRWVAPDQLAVLREGVLLYEAKTTDPALIQAIHTLYRDLILVGVTWSDGGDDMWTPNPPISDPDALSLLGVLARHYPEVRLVV